MAKISVEKTNKEEVQGTTEKQQKIKPIRLVLQKGTLRLEEPWEFTKKNWKKKKDEEEDEEDEMDIHFYKATTIDKRYEVVDLDKTEAGPLTRSILGQIGLFPELRIVKNIRVLLIVALLILILVFVRTGGGTKQADFEKSQKEVLDKITSVCSTPSAKIKNSFSSGALDQIKQDVQEKPQEAPKKEEKKPSFNIFPWAKN